MPMSARLIKGGTGAVSHPFAPFAITGSTPTVSQPSVSGLSFSLPIEDDDPDAIAAQIIATAEAKAAHIERQAVENSQALIQAEVDAEVARIIEPWQEQ